MNSVFHYTIYYFAAIGFYLLKFTKIVVIKRLLFFAIIISLSGVIIHNLQSEYHLSSYVENSGPFLGTNVPRSEGIDGEGVIISVIDTGVDFNHPDLFGYGSGGKVIGGYNFINEEEPPIDTNGHGTQVAGIIAADGKVSGIAPKSKILAYKVSNDGEGVESGLIIKAIRKSIEDGADIINISLGVNKTNSQIEEAVMEALEKEIFVVTAAGNDGPKKESIGSPGKNFGSITVGATYNNLTSSLVATLEVNEKPYTVIPMMGSKKLDEPIVEELVFADYGRERDFEKTNVEGKIVLVERGSDVEDEIVYFSTKEKNAANSGAKALIVYNNEAGIFLGELIHEFVESEYEPRIPVVSIDRQEGLEIKEKIKNKNKGLLHLFFNPDFVAHFSSRGPVSPFYIKPDIVAPGAYINTTKNGGSYNFTSGTSYAAPHVSGAAALLIDKYPKIHHHEIKSLLITTAEPVYDALGEKVSVYEAGAGRVNIAKAISSDLIIEPPHLVLIASSDQPTTQKKIHLNSLKQKTEELTVDYEIPEFLKFDYSVDEKSLNFKITATQEKYGIHEGKIFLIHNKIKHIVPFVLHYTEGSVNVDIVKENMQFSINQPENWKYAKISATNSKSGKTETTTITPLRESRIPIYQNGEYWIEANILSNEQIVKAYQIIQVNNISEDKTKPLTLFDLPKKQIGIIAIIIVSVSIAGMYFRRTKKFSDQRF